MAGQPTKYRKEYNKQVYKLCLLNATDKQIADYFEVTEQTITNWKKQYPSFFGSIKDGKIRADAEVAESLHGRAVGCSVPEDRVFHNPSAKRKKDRIIIVKGRKHFPPDTAAAFIWLKNRQGWTDRKEVILKDDRYTQEQRDAIRAELAGRCVNRLEPGALPVLPSIDAEVVNVQEQRQAERG